MGQYYKPIVLDENNKPVAWVYSHEYDNGLKLMEHSWLRNDFVAAFESLICPTGKHHGKRVVWAGDYADPEPVISNALSEATTDLDILTAASEGVDGENLYSMCEDEKKVKPKALNADGEYGTKYRYVVNHTTKEFVDKHKVPITDTWEDPKTNKKYSFRINPLPLLTCEGNGRGGGDYHGDSELVGKWARNVVTVEEDKPKGYSELIFDLTE